MLFQLIRNRVVPVIFGHLHITYWQLVLQGEKLCLEWYFLKYWDLGENNNNTGDIILIYIHLSKFTFSKVYQLLGKNVTESQLEHSP